MLQKNHRLRKNKHFLFIYKRGQAKHTNGLTLVYMPTKHPYQVGFSIGKKIGKATVRNKVKRRLRESFRQIEQQADQKTNYVFVAKEGIEKLSFAQICSEMQTVMKKAGLLKTE